MSDSSDIRAHWRACSICKTAIHFGATYHQCSVSTCNRKRTGLAFCSVRCWEAHVPTLRHRDAWALEATAPTREAWEAEQRDAVPTDATAKIHRQVTRRLVAPPVERRAPLSDDADRDILIVASKLKKYIKQRSGLRTSDGVLPLLSDLVRAACDEAIRRAADDERTTVLDRDVPRGWRPD